MADSPRTLAQGLRRLLPLFLVAVALLAWGDLLARVIGPALAAQHFPGSVYWVGPRLVLGGQGLVLLDHVAFAEAALTLGANSDLGFLPFAPSAAILLLPLGLLAEAPAYFAWTAASLVALFAALAMLLAALRPPATLTLLILAGVPLFHPLRANFAVGQAYALVLLALVAYAVLGYAGHAERRRGREPLAALAAGVIAVLKTNYGLLLMLPALVARRWGLLAMTGAFFVVVALPTLPIVGIAGWAAWVDAALGWRARPETSVTAYQTLHSMLAHLLRFDPEWNRAPVLDLPILAELMWYVAAAVLVIISSWALVRLREAAGSRPQLAARRLLPVALVVPVASLVSPIAENYHYLLDLLPLIVVATIVCVERPRSLLPWITFAGAIFLLAPAWPFANREVDGWWALLFYPRVYGALLLWGALMWLAVHETRAPVEASK